MMLLAGSLLILVLVALSALFSGAETGLYCANHLRVRLHSDQGVAAARRLRSLLADEQQALAVVLVGTNVANYLTTLAAALVLSHQLDLAGRRLELYTTLLVTPILFVFGEVLPKNLFQQAPDRLLYAVSLPLLVARRLLSPVAWIIQRLSVLALRVVASGGPTRQALDHRERVGVLLREALAGGDHARSHGRFVQGVLGLSNTAIRSVMVPASQVAAVPADADREEFLELVGRCAHTRFPVYERDGGRIIGAVHAHTLLSDPSWQRVGDRLQAAPRLGPDSSVAAALVQVRRSELRLAVVEDADGRLLGIATLQDLFEEIVGELDA